MALSFQEASKNLKKHDLRTQKQVIALYNSVNETLKALIIDDTIKLRKAQQMLIAEYDKALISQNFVESWKAGTVRTIVNSSYSESVLLRSKPTYAQQLLKTSLFKDKVTLSVRLRKNSNLIVINQKKILRNSLTQGRAVAQIARNITNDFTKSLPKFLDELATARIAGERLPSAAIRNAKKISKGLKTEGLRKNYLKLIDGIQLGGNIDKLVSNAMVARTRFFSNRVARSETIQALSEVKNAEAMEDPDTQLVQNITSGSNPCPFCISMENIGFVPVENATIATHHPNCSCTPIYKKTTKRPKKWSNDTFNMRLQAEINKQNKIAIREGRPRTYVPIVSPTNLRNNTIVDKLNKV